MTIRPFIFSLLLVTFFSSLFLFACSAPETEASERPPNIVVILADDVGWNELGFNNDRKKYTPHIDRLRASGLSLTQFYVHAVCAPSRTAFLTGRYPFRNWTDCEFSLCKT